MEIAWVRMTISAALAVAVLAGCEGTTGGAGGGGETGEPVIDATVGAKPERRTGRGGGDVEAPDVFSTTAEALWDGRPSLGGVWVASPDAVDPERVVIKNPKNGKSVTGALFRRERENPGPKLQLSSDAATALGLLAGQPGTVSVVALRREQAVVAEAEPEAVAESEGEAAEAVAATGAAADGEGEAIGAAAVAAIGKEGAEAAAEGPAEAAEAAAGVAAAAPEEPGRRGLFGGLFRRKAAEPDPGEPLSAIDPEAAAATPAPAAEGAATAAPATAAKGSGRTHVIMIGAFGVEANATAAAEKLGQAGYKATITPGKLGERDIWKVTGSAAGDRDALLAEIKALGYADAYVEK